MNKRLFSILFCTIFSLSISAPVYAEKPAWAGSGKPPTAEQKQQHKTMMQNKNGDKDDKQKTELDETTEAEKSIDKKIEDVKERTRPWWQIFD
ncbi:hypothetical protein [Thiomicrorhabdus sediminis]|uniref:Uncharacterized protein n=1 Tax=Thiomicrorhabdus sediminis TaxID=2580412 RepID=A0A4P9K7W5_9GAMM|nr:hypothetical protein [Thiomicrorhabdus sediminis]QCU90337.1 hypothetical protein FE785_06690 [Thiomicrorhabdus sediminis]